ncbi:MAG: NAD+ synthase [Chlamydiales bacterium]|nr:NAD+ synthase [Chlamydiales bacterium]
MKITLAQINPTVGAIALNKERIIASIHQAKKEKSDLLLTPELALCGYPPLDLLFLPHFVEDLEKALLEILPETKDITILLGTVRKNPSKKEKFLFNSAALLQNGQILDFYDKQLLPTYDVFDERRYFEPGTKPLIFELCQKRMAVTICEDLWQHSKLLKDTCYYHDPVLQLQSKNIDLLLNLSASPYSIHKPHTRIEIAKRAAITLKCPLILCNQVGANDGLIFDGHSMLIDAHGKLNLFAKGFSEEILSLSPFSHAPINPSYNEIEGLYRALVMGVRDYFHKLGFTKACLGLSGGIDSALVACIATEALGPENVLALSMPSLYSSNECKKDALFLAKTLKIRFKELSIDPLFQCFLNTLSQPLNLATNDITEENLQARIRGMLLMAFSNKENSLLLNTANKSELAMGYSTLYGDSCGALSVLGDVYKTMLYQLANWIHDTSHTIPLSIIERAPSAELRPNQKDSDSLPDYDLLDKILCDYIEMGLSIKEIGRKNNVHPDYVAIWIKKLHQNEYKRKQSPLILRVTEKALTPLVGRHIPTVHKYIR